jgi:hypothetical protein
MVEGEKLGLRCPFFCQNIEWSLPDMSPIPEDIEVSQRIQIAKQNEAGRCTHWY